MKNILIISLIFGISIFLFFVISADKEPVMLPGTKDNHEYPNQEFANTVWNVLSDPKQLTKYCDAQFTKNSNEATCIVSSDSADQARVFSSALWEIWSGHTQLAKEKLEQLYEDKTWSLWGGVGLLELAHHTGNQNELTSLLEQLKEGFLSSENPQFISSYEFYELWYAKNNFEWARLENLLAKYSEEKINNDPELFFLQSSVFFTNGREPELKELLDEVSPVVKKTIYYVYSLVNYTSLKSGIKESDSIINKFVTTRPEDTELAAEKIYLELLDDNPAIVEDALNRLYDIVDLSSKDVNLILHMMLTLATDQKYDESVKVFNIANFGDDVVLEDFVMYHTFSAWEHVHMGEYDSAFYKLEKSINMAPKDTAANGLKVLLAKKFERPDLALSSLKILLETNPHNESYRNLILYFRNKYETPELEVLYRRMIGHN